MIPQKFLQRMQSYLDEASFEAFCAALERPPVRAFRVNTDKTDDNRLLPLLPFRATPLPFLPHAYYATDDKIGAHPAHHAGMLYMQDPGAISTVAALEPGKGLRVLDLCAAPGGKSTQLACAIGTEGVLVSNEYITARARILQGNVERMGVKNTVVTNLDSKTAADFYGSYFDLVVVDAPCSGEGMLRKYEAAAEEWSEENVTLCATRQRDILQNAARCVAPGGRLLYATCTWSLAENEENVAWFLDTFPDFSLLPVSDSVAAVTVNGMAINGRDLSRCRRFYPHVSPGEGQFIALLQRAPDSRATSPQKDSFTPLTRTETAVVEAFFKDTLQQIPQGRLCRLGDKIFLSPNCPLPPRGVFAAGVCVGTLIKGRLDPHHQLYSAYGADFKRTLALNADDIRVTKYLNGEEIDAPELQNMQNGFAAVLFEGAPLGGSKHVAGRLKNHYPKGLRNK